MVILAKFFTMIATSPNLIIGLSIDVLVDVVRSIDDGLVVSFDVRLRIRLKKGLGEE
jgi:hypothetical protein